MSIFISLQCRRSRRRNLEMPCSLPWLLLVLLVQPLSRIHHATADVLATYNAINALDSTTSEILLAQVSNLRQLYPPIITSTSLVSVVGQTCVAGGYSLIDSQSCMLCVAGKYSVTVSATSVNTCLSCGLGTYSNVTGAGGPSTCLQCPANTYNAVISGASLAACLPCPAFSGSYVGSQLLQSCVCLPGYSGANGTQSERESVN